jgi:hypothetical protein
MLSTLKKFMIQFSLVGAMLVPCLLPAQQATDTVKTPMVRRRQVNQQKRIHQGVKSGELTRLEARKLEREQARVQRSKVRAKSDGQVTPRERLRLQRQQNKASRDIYRQKHDGQTRN